MLENMQTYAQCNGQRHIESERERERGGEGQRGGKREEGGRGGREGGREEGGREENQEERR